MIVDWFYIHISFLSDRDSAEECTCPEGTRADLGGGSTQRIGVLNLLQLQLFILINIVFMISIFLFSHPPEPR